MEGADVPAWQGFLAGRRLFDGTIDGRFGAATERASIAYQESVNLEADGIVGDRTFVRSHQDGFSVPGETTVTGFDASTDCRTKAACLAGARMSFAVRYYADAAAKTLKLPEARALCVQGLSLVAVYQDFNDEIGRFSAAEGTRQATNALRHAARIGQPAGTAIYFAVDMNATPAETGGVISDYFRAVNAVLAAAATQYAPGVYGSGLVCRTIRDAGLARFTWLSGSTGFFGSKAFRAEADLVQVLPQRLVCEGLTIDDDIAPRPGGFGAFKI
jgi:peptidoglycan hydrolase-like protein with peptidoglycan-binding domain